MSLDVFDTIKSTFGSLKAETGLKIFGLLFVIQLVNMGSSYLGTMGTGAAVLSGLLGLIAVIASILVMVGAFRSFDSGTVSIDQYTSNIGWPVVRIFGANIVTAVFAYGMALVAFLPAILVAVLMGAGLTALSSGTAGAAAGGGLVAGLLGLLGLALGAVAFAYVFLMLTVSIPMIAVDDNRIFQALDRSVQRTQGEKIGMFLAALPIIAIQIVGIGLILVSGAATGTTQPASPVMLLLSSVVTALTGTLFFSLLNQYHQRLPE